MFECKFDSKQHHIIEPEIYHWAVNNTPDSEKANVFVYRHRKHNTFVIAYWVGRGKFIDMVHIGTSLNAFTRKQALEFLNRIHRKDNTNRLRNDLKMLRNKMNKASNDDMYKLNDEMQYKMRQLRS